MPSLGTRFRSLPLLRTLASPRFRLVLAVLVAAVASARLAGLISESLANMDDYRRFFVVASRMAWHGVSPYHALPVALSRQDLGNVGSFMTPPFLMLFGPWTRLADDVGRSLWIGLEILAVVGLLLAVYRGLGRPSWAEALMAGSLLAFFPPLRDSIQEGQLGVFLGLALALALLCHQRRRPLIGGAALGVVIAVKLTPVLVLPYFIYRRDWRLCLSALATAAALALLTLGLGWAHYWPTFAADVGAAANGTALVRNQSLNGILLRAWRPELNGLPIAPVDLPFRAVWVAAQCVVVAGVVATIRRSRLSTVEREWTELSIIVLLLPLIQPYAWEHHFAQAIMIVPVSLHLISRHRLGLLAAMSLGVVFVAYLLLEFPGYIAANAAEPAVLKASIGLQLAASITAVAALLSGALLATAGGRPGGSRLLHLARFMRIQHR